MDLVYYKSAEANDFDELWLLVEESLSDLNSEITRESLREDLFGEPKFDTKVLENQCDPFIELDLDQAPISHPICEIITAQKDKDLLGYLIFHQFYSPWMHRGVFVDNIYVRQAHRRKGVASGLVNELKRYCRNENLVFFLYDTDRPGVPTSIRDALIRHGSKLYRGDETDWSVYRIEF